MNEEIERWAQARIGRVLKDRWRLERLIGHGGMACVYEATHRNAKRVAIKMLKPELSLDATQRKRFLREGYAANKIGHPGVVIVDDDDVDEDGSAFLVMELLIGESLADKLDRYGTLDPVQVLQIADQLLDVLSAAHAKGIVHRDIKPENLFETSDGMLKVLDFGIARLLEGGSGGTTASTKAGTVMGTPAFMAPEQACGYWDKVDARTDLWAVGATMFTLLSGQCVHEGETANVQLAKAITEAARSLGSLVPELPSDVVALVDRALLRSRDERWQSAAHMQERVRELLNALGGVSLLPRASLRSSPRMVEAETLPLLDPISIVPQSVPRGDQQSLANASLAGVGSDPESAPRRRGAVIAGSVGAAALVLGVVVVLGSMRKVAPSGAPEPTASREPAAAPSRLAVTAPAVSPQLSPPRQEPAAGSAASASNAPARAARAPVVLGVPGTPKKLAAAAKGTEPKPTPGPVNPLDRRH